MLCRRLDLFTEASVAIDGSKFKAVNNRDQNFTRAKMERRLAQIEESVARYLQQLDSADRQEPSHARESKTTPAQREDRETEDIRGPRRRALGRRSGPSVGYVNWADIVVGSQSTVADDQGAT